MSLLAFYARHKPAQHDAPISQLLAHHGHLHTACKSMAASFAACQQAKQQQHKSTTAQATQTRQVFWRPRVSVQEAQQLRCGSSCAGVHLSGTATAGGAQHTCREAAAPHELHGAIVKQHMWQRVVAAAVLVYNCTLQQQRVHMPAPLPAHLSVLLPSTTMISAGVGCSC